MGKGIGTRTPTDKLIHRLRLMADSGGMLTKNRIRDIIESADRMEELDERVAIMSETEGQGFNVFRDIPHYPEVTKHET